MTRIVPDAWMPAVRMQRIIVHWTAGTHTPSANDRSHYHILIDARGKLVRGTPAISGNATATSKPRANHTLNCNTGSIGVSLCCMGNAVERPFSSGKWPMTEAQWAALALVLADLCGRYSIAIGPKTVLSHAEVQSNLGIKQKGKWDIARISFLPTVKGAKACGDLMRKNASAALSPAAALAHSIASIVTDDGGEPDDTVLQDEQDDDDRLLNVQPQTAHYDPYLEAVQQKLIRVGYHEVGGAALALWWSARAATEDMVDNKRTGKLS